MRGQGPCQLEVWQITALGECRVHHPCSLFWHHGSWPRERTLEPVSQLSVSWVGICDRDGDKGMMLRAEMELGLAE